MSKIHLSDERTEQLNGRAALVVMLLMQIALAGSLFVRRYLLGDLKGSAPEIPWILFLSVIGYWGFRVFLSGVLSPMSIRRSLLVYLAVEVILIGVSYLIHGWPARENWAIQVLPMLVAPAVLVGAYNLIAILGRKRMEREISA